MLTYKDLKEVQLQFPVDKENVQNVPFKAALYNLKGIIAFELKENEAAKASFEQALSIFS